MELVLVADKSVFEKHGHEVSKIYNRCKDIANIVNAVSYFCFIVDYLRIFVSVNLQYMWWSFYFIFFKFSVDLFVIVIVIVVFVTMTYFKQSYISKKYIPPF